MKETLTNEEIHALHAAALEAYGGMPGLRDAGMLDSALAQPLMTFGGQSVYNSLWDKVAALGRSLVCNHAFVDGNKRVGFAAMAVILRFNGYDLDCSTEESEQMVLRVATGELKADGIAKWLESHAVRIKSDC